MLLRRLLLAAGIVLALLVWLMMPGGKTNPPAESEESRISSTQHQGGPTQPEFPISGESQERQELDAGADSPLTSEIELGIPAFRGKLVLPNGNPAQQGKLEVWGSPGWALVLDRTLQEAPATVHQQFPCTRDGSFLVAEPPRDGLRYILRFSAPDCAPLLLENLMTHPGRTRDLGTLRLTLGGQLQGTVLGNHGQPLAGAQIRVIPEPSSLAFSADDPSEWPSLPGFERTTQNGGDFALEHLPVGHLHLRVRFPGWLPARSPTLQVGDGDTLPNQVLQMVPSHPIRGRVLDLSQGPIGTAQILLEARDQLDSFAHTDEKGRFALDAPEFLQGPVLRVAAPGYLPTRVAIHDRSQELLVTLNPATSLQGQLTDPAGHPVVGGKVRLVLVRHSRDLRSGIPTSLPDQGSALSDEAGNFSLFPDWSATWSRRFRLVAWADDLLPSWSSAFKLTEEGTTNSGPFDLVLQPGSMVHGQVFAEDGLPKADARVFLRRLGTARPGRRDTTAITLQRGWMQGRTTTSSDGSFHFPGLPLADFQLMAFAPNLSPVAGKEFVLKPGGHEEVLHLLASSGIHGQILGDRTPFPRLKVTAVTPGMDPLDTWVNEQGDFTFHNLFPAMYELILRPVDGDHAGSAFSFGNGAGLARVAGVVVETSATTPVTLHLQLQELAQVQGQVFQGGQPASGLTLFLVPQDLSSGISPLLGWRSMVRRMRSTQTKEEGSYRFAGVDPDDYWLVVDRGARWPRGWAALANPLQGDPTPLGLARRTLALRAGDDLTVDFQLAEVSSHDPLPSSR